MIYLHPSLGITNAPSTPPRISDPSYIDRIYEFVGVQKAQFSLVIEASNGTVLDDIKETRLTAHLFDADGRELTEHLAALSLYWEEHNEAWTEVGRGWSYLVNDTSRFLRLLRVRVSQLDIMTALGVTIDAETKKTLAGIMVQQEVKITSSSSIYNRIPSADLIHQQLVNDAKFRELVKGAKGEPGKSISIEDLGITWQDDKLVVAGKASQSLIGPTGPAGVQGIRGPQGIQGPKGAEGKPGAKGEPGKSISIEDLGITWQDDKLVVAGKASQSLIGPTGPAGVQGIRGPQGIQGPKGAEGKPGAKGEPGKSVTPQEVADAINTADWQNQIASATASNIIKTPTLSDKLRDLVQPDTTELIKRLSSRTMRQDILSQNGGKYLINVPAFALFEPEVEDGAAISLQVNIRQPIGSCTNPNNHDERGYFFIVKSWEPIYTTSAEKLCNKGGEIKVYYDSEQCAESLLSIKLERSNDHWVFVNYYDFAASIQADCTQIATQSHYSNKSQDEMLSYASLQYLSGKKRNAVLPSGRVGIVIRVWANKWVGDVRVRTELGESLYNTSDSTGGNIGSDGALIPAGHIGEFICINEEKIWLYTDLSR